MKKVLVVGAGPAGLTAAKVLSKTGKFDVTVFEKSNRIGGIWAVDQHSTGGFLSPETPTNLSRFTVGFSDLDWNSVDLGSSVRKTPMFPKAWHVNRYLEAYRERYIPADNIKFNREVIKAERLVSGGTGKWRILSRDSQAHEQSTEFDYLFLGTGFFSRPRPLSHSIPGLDPKPAVRTIHSSQFRKLEDLLGKPENANGKKILIIGGGNSAGEVAAAIAQQLSNAEHSPELGPQHLYKGCKIVHVTARPFYALPPYTPHDDTCTTFMPLDLSLYDLSKRPAGPIIGNAGQVPKIVKDRIHTAMQDIVGDTQLGTPALEIPISEPRSTAYAALTESYSEFVRSGDLIEAVGGRVVALEAAGNGTATAQVKCVGDDRRIDDIAAVVYATGYSPAEAVDFLDDDVKRLLHYDASNQRLPLILQGWQTMTPEVPELALSGFYEGPYWPMIEMQARLTAERWLSEKTYSVRPYEGPEKMLKLRQAMQERGLDVPQYWFGDYAGYLEEMASELGLQRNDGDFTERQGCASPARYLSADSNKTQADAIMKDLYTAWKACREEGRYVARAVFRALQGTWTFRRSIESRLPSFPSATVDGQAGFHPRLPTKDKSGMTFDLEYLYTELGTLTLSSGASMPARRSYVYRYSEERDTLSVWFVKPDSDLEVDYLFHDLHFASPQEAKQEGSCVAKADHLCVDDMYWTKYRLPMKGVSLLQFETKHTVKGPNKDYVTKTSYSRPS